MDPISISITEKEGYEIMNLGIYSHTHEIVQEICQTAAV